MTVRLKVPLIAIVMALVSSCDDPNDFGWKKIHEDDSIIAYFNVIDSDKSGDERNIKVRVDGKGGNSTATLNSKIICSSRKVSTTSIFIKYQDQDGSTKTIEKSFGEDFKQMPLGLLGDKLHNAAC